MDPLGESPWADAPAQPPPSSSTSESQAAGDDETPKPASEAAPSATTSSGPRPSRLTPRRLVAQPTKLQAVEDDPLGPLGAAEPVVSGAEGEPPMPPQKEPPAPAAMSSTLPVRTMMSPGQQQQRRGVNDPHRVDDEDDGDDRLGSSGGRAPPPVQAATPVQGRGAGPPSVSVEQAAKPSFSITVGDPHKVGDLTSSHIVYAVRTKVCLVPALKMWQLHLRGQEWMLMLLRWIRPRPRPTSSPSSRSRGDIGTSYGSTTPSMRTTQE